MSCTDIILPKEIGSIDQNCIICFDTLKWAVFCSRCNQSTCFECIKTWLTEKNDCPKCRRPCRLSEYSEQKELYSCCKDGSLIEYYCEKCNECFCRNCLGKKGPHYRHPVRSLDVLRKETIDALDTLKELQSKDALKNIKALIREGVPRELVRQRKSVEREIDEVLPTLPGEPPRSTYRLPNAAFSEVRTKNIVLDGSGVERCVANDEYGNVWELTVHPYGVKEVEEKFISLFLKLVDGTPMRYEYRFSMHTVTSPEPLAEYYALDDFGIGTESKACQRLISLEAARNKTGSYGYQIMFGTRPTDMLYGLQCAKHLATNKHKRLDFKTFTFRVERFHENRKNDAIIFSEVMYDQQNIAWRFRIDCNGHQEQGQYISTYLELLNGAKGWFDIFIEIVHPKDTMQSFRKHLTHEFEVHSNWGIPHFLNCDRTEDYLQGDTLLFTFGVRPAHIEEEALGL
ncbi:uncharacterized protein LOC131428222 [Malaya genurostris]|uniref:uncharacterized protein LOC131428222 n=1 Tax=Malaya genurostris TaxID=325434 RepID=UPI0026F3DC6A|nr:uncharacterized protein LOC131428222 [Malaya genurostris]